MKKVIQLLIALAIVLVGFLIARSLIKTAPEAEKIALEKTFPIVETIQAKKSSPAPLITTQAEIQPPKRTTLSAQVMGRVIQVSPVYEIGGQLNEGEVILKVEDTDYRTALANAKSAKAQAEASLQEAQVSYQLEEAKVAQAKRDWAKLGGGKEPSALLLRQPQLRAIEARISSATATIAQTIANIEQAQRELERTIIRAPYNCQIERKEIDLGALVTIGMPLCTLYERGSVEARLPIALEDLPHIKVSSAETPVPVTARANFGNTQRSWTGKIVRSENRIDPETRTSFIIAEFTGESLPPVGLFTQLEITGEPLKNVFAVPRIALRGQAEVIIITDDDTVEFRKVTLTRSTEKEVYLSEGVGEGERICTTIMNTPIEGMKVKVTN